MAWHQCVISNLFQSVYENAMGQFQSIQVDGTEPSANTLNLDILAMPELML